MTPERWQQVERLYHEARTRPPGERDALSLGRRVRATTPCGAKSNRC